MRKKTYALYSRRRGHYCSDKPGQFAAVVTQGVAGRLDCPGGKQAHPENRIFLRYLEDMPPGFRPCRICHPERLRVGDHLDWGEKRAIKLDHQPHIALWALGLLKRGNDKEYEPTRWYVALNWVYTPADGCEEEHHQCTLSPTHRYHRALSLALKEGRRLNLPVVKHDTCHVTVLWLPTSRANTEQKKAVAELRNGPGVICP